METGKMYLSKTGEAFRCIGITDQEVQLATFDGDYVLNGPVANLDGFMQATGMQEITEDEYKLRVVAMRAFQDMKHDKDYPYKKSYLGQYDEMKGFMTKEAVDSFFQVGGGYRDYSKDEPKV
jgi:hypothetical protein